MYYLGEFSPNFLGFPGGSYGKESACNEGDPGSIPGSGRSAREGNGNPLQYSWLVHPMDGGAWVTPVHGSPRIRQDWVSSLSLFPQLYRMKCTHTFPEIFKVVFKPLKNAFFRLSFSRMHLFSPTTNPKHLPAPHPATALLSSLSSKPPY